MNINNAHALAEAGFSEAPTVGNLLRQLPGWDLSFDTATKRFVAWLSIYDEDGEFDVYGDTPEDALADAWLLEHSLRTKVIGARTTRTARLDHWKKQYFLHKRVLDDFMAVGHIDNPNAWHASVHEMQHAVDQLNTLGYYALPGVDKKKADAEFASLSQSKSST